MRIESDSLGTKAVESSAYYGIHTQRARENFPVTDTWIFYWLKI